MEIFKLHHTSVQKSRSKKPVFAVSSGRRAVCQSSHYTLAQPRMPPARLLQLSTSCLRGTRLHFVPSDREGNMNKCLATSLQAGWGEDLAISDSRLFKAEAVPCLCLVQQERERCSSRRLESFAPSTVACTAQ